MTELHLRNASEHDDEVVLSLLQDMHRESGLGSINKSKVINAIRHCRQLGCIIIAEVQGVPKAVLGLRPDRFWWSDDFGLFDQFTYVAPEARKTKAIFKMVKAADNMALTEFEADSGDHTYCGH